MSLQNTPALRLPLLQAGQAQKHITLNESLWRLDALAQARVKSRTVTPQPATPQEGDAYILPEGASGVAWDDFDAGDFAVYQGGYWDILSLPEGALVHVADQGGFVVRTGGGWAPLQATLSSAIREKLSGDITYYVNPYSGDDTNDGSPGAPFRSLHGAYEKCKKLDANGFSVTIKLTNGTYPIGNFAFDVPIVGASVLNIIGDTADPSNVYILNSGYTLFTFRNGCNVTLSGVKLEGGSGEHLLVELNTKLIFNHIIFGTCGGHHIAIFGGSVEVPDLGAYTIAGNALRHASVNWNGVFITNNVSVTLSFSPSVSDYFMFVSTSAVVTQWNPTYSGVFGTGAKYLVTTNAVISGWSWALPGTAGTTELGGQAI